MISLDVLSLLIESSIMRNKTAATGPLPIKEHVVNIFLNAFVLYWTEVKKSFQFSLFLAGTQARGQHQAIRFQDH